MVSGLVTSPCDQLRIFSGEARLMRIASKSAIGFAMSKGLERYKVVLRFLRLSRDRWRLLIGRWSLAIGRWPNQRKPLRFGGPRARPPAFIVHTRSAGVPPAVLRASRPQLRRQPGSPTTGDRRLTTDFLIR